MGHRTANVGPVGPGPGRLQNTQRNLGVGEQVRRSTARLIAILPQPSDLLFCLSACGSRRRSERHRTSDRHDGGGARPC